MCIESLAQVHVSATTYNLALRRDQAGLSHDARETSLVPYVVGALLVSAPTDHDGGERVLTIGDVRLEAPATWAELSGAASHARPPDGHPDESTKHAGKLLVSRNSELRILRAYFS